MIPPGKSFEYVNLAMVSFQHLVMTSLWNKGIYSGLHCEIKKSSYSKLW